MGASRADGQTGSPFRGENGGGNYLSGEKWKHFENIGPENGPQRDRSSA